MTKRFGSASKQPYQRSTTRAFGGFSAVRPLLIAMLLAGVSVGCGAEKIVAVGGGPLDDVGVDTIQPDGFQPDASTDGTTPDGTVNPGLGREILLLHDTTNTQQLIITEQLLVRAKVIDYAAGGPAVNTLVQYEVIDETGGGDANLTSSQAWTNDNGEVGVTFRANFAADISYRIRISTEGATPVELSLRVVAQPTGDIRVNLQYEGPIAIKNVHLRLMPANYTCGQFKATNVPTEPIGEKTLLGLSGAGADSVVFDGLPADQKFTIVATAQSPTGSLAAAGCLDGVLVVGEQENTVTMTMYLLVLNPAGWYDANNVFDFTGAIPGELGVLIDEIVLLFNDPGQFLINRVKDVVSAFIGELITDIAFGLFEDALSDIITDWMLNQSPAWLQDIFTIGQDLTQIVNNLHMQATLVISKLSNDYYVQGIMYWTGIKLYWKLGCPAEGEAGYDPECGANTFDISDFTNTDFPMDIVEGKFTGLIHDFDRLDVDNHSIKINYGKLIIFVLNEIILPALTGEDNLTDAIISFVNCGSIAATFSNGILDAIGVSESDIEGFCVDAITFIAKPVELILGSLALDSQLRLTGAGILVDSNDDLIVDQIIDGTYLGHIEVDGTEGPQFDGTWDAIRQQATP